MKPNLTSIRGVVIESTPPVIFVAGGNYSITFKEKLCLQSAANGLSNKLIATMIGNRPQTVKNHLSRAYIKLGCDKSKGISNPRVVAVVRAYEGGLIT